MDNLIGELETVDWGAVKILRAEFEAARLVYREAKAKADTAREVEMEARGVAVRLEQKLQDVLIV